MYCRPGALARPHIDFPPAELNNTISSKAVDTGAKPIGETVEICYGAGFDNKINIGLERRVASQPKIPEKTTNYRSGVVASEGFMRRLHPTCCGKEIRSE
jgi:hypothetical protein